MIAIARVQETNCMVRNRKGSPRKSFRLEAHSLHFELERGSPTHRAS